MSQDMRTRDASQGVPISGYGVSRETSPWTNQAVPVPQAQAEVYLTGVIWVTANPSDGMTYGPALPPKVHVTGILVANAVGAAATCDVVGVQPDGSTTTIASGLDINATGVAAPDTFAELEERHALRVDSYSVGTNVDILLGFMVAPSTRNWV